MTVPMLCPDAAQARRGIPRGGPPAAQNGLEAPSDKSQPVDASSAPWVVVPRPILAKPTWCRFTWTVSRVFPFTIPNAAYTNIKICAPGDETNCQVIDHVQVDTGSTGLRIASKAVNPKLLA